jgi:hypothetical protein
MVTILQRELQREARKPRALGMRLLWSGLGFAAGVVLLLWHNGGGAHGRYVFDAVTAVAFWFCLTQGVRVAAGTIADEKRDGTLGLLFLTSLTPLGIVAGKFFAVAIPLIQPFLAMVPALAITVLHGGVTGSEVVRAVAAVGTVLVFSIALGLCVSSVSRRNEKVGRRTLLLLFVAVGGPLLVARAGFGWAAVSSPWTAFRNIHDERYVLSGGEFWLSVVAMLYAALGLVVAAAYFLPRRWEVKLTASQWSWPRVAWGKVCEAERLEMLERNPGEWLARRGGVNLMEEIPFAVMLVGLAFAACAAPTRGAFVSVAFLAVLVAAVLLMVRLASQASAPLCNARRSGEVELLLSTPLSPMALIAGQIAALRKQFFAPVVIVFAAALFYCERAMASPFEGFFGFLLFGLYFGALIVSIAALGMFIGLVEKSPTSAFYQTLFIVIGIALPLSLLSAPIPLIPLMILGFAGNRLASSDLEKYLKRQPRARRAAVA